MIRRTAALVLLLAGVAWAHFPIATPAELFLTKGKTTRVTWAYGHPYEVEQAPAAKPLRARLFPPQGEPAALSALALPGKPARWAFDVTPTQRGDHLLLIEGAPLAHGQDQVFDFSKLVLPVSGVERGWDRAAGAPLEIVPLTRPYGLPDQVTLRAQVLRAGKPLAGAIVQLERRNDAAPKQLPHPAFITRSEKTDAQGVFSASLTGPCWWILAVEAPTGEKSPQGGQVVQRATLWLHVGQPRGE